MLGAKPFEAMLVAFQRAMKEKSPESLNALVAAARRTNWQAFSEAMGPLARDACPDCLRAIAPPDISTDLAMVVMQALISRTEIMTDGPYRVKHDESKNLATYHDLLQAFIDHTDEVELRQTAIASFKFPLKLTKVAQVNPTTSPAIQLADVMLGAALEAGNIMTGQRTEGLDPDTLLPFFKDDQLIHMLPDLDFEAQKEFRRGTQASEVIDYFAVELRLQGQGVLIMAGKTWEAAKARNPAEVYNEKRQIIIAQMQKDSAVAKTWLDGYRNTLGPAGYAGLKAEVALFAPITRRRSP